MGKTLAQGRRESPREGVMVEYLKKAQPQEEGVTQKVRDAVSEILLAVQKEGIAAVRRYSERLDGWNPESFVVSEEEIRRADESVDDELKGHIRFAQEQVENFARLQKETLVDFERETLPGVVLGQKQIPVNAVGSYTPSGMYPMFGSSIMTVAVAKVGGVKRVVAIPPPRKGKDGKPYGVYEPMLYTMASCGADQILCVGGVQALAAVSFGMEEVEPVDMIVGAGHAYVAEAKRQLFGQVGIDLLAGPTEIAIIADDTADPHLLAADLLGQAEHGPTSPAVLITTSREVGEETIREVDRWLDGDWPTKDMAGEAISDGEYMHGHALTCRIRQVRVKQRAGA